MNNVLIALNYDVSDVNVAEAGFLFAKRMNVKVIFLRLIPELDVYSNVGDIIVKGFFAGHLKVKTEPVKKPLNIKKITQDFLNKIKFHLGSNTIQSLIKESSSEIVILETAKELNADVIVMGSQGRNWSNDRLIGSTTQQVLSNTTIPALIIPIKEKY